MRYPRKKVYLGQKFGKLTVIDDNPIHVRLPSGSKYTKYKVRCFCGKEFELVKHNLFKTHVKSCGCFQYVERTKAKSYSPSYKLFSDYRSRAKRKKLEFELTFERFIELTSQICYYCRKPPIQKRHSENINNFYIYNGLDRKNNLRGYTIANVVPCCKICNSAKSTLSVEEFYNWVLKVVEVIKEKKVV